MKLREICEKYGVVKDVYIPIDHYSKRPKSFAFVEFESQSSATAALDALNNTDLAGKVLEVLIAKTGRKSRDEMKSQSRNNRDDGRRQNDRDYRRRSRSRGYDRRCSRSRDRDPRRRSRSRDYERRDYERRDYERRDYERRDYDRRRSRSRDYERRR